MFSAFRCLRLVVIFRSLCLHYLSTQHLCPCSVYRPLQWAFLPRYRDPFIGISDVSRAETLMRSINRPREQRQRESRYYLREEATGQRRVMIPRAIEMITINVVRGSFSVAALRTSRWLGGEGNGQLRLRASWFGAINKRRCVTYLHSLIVRNGNLDEQG